VASNVELQIDERWAPQVDPARLQRAVTTTLEVEGISGEPGVTVVLVGDEEMIHLHEAYRNEPVTTDVLSFPYDQSEPDPSGEMVGYLGDVVICYPQAARQAEEEGHSTQNELDLLAVHGTLHLLGYDDETANDQLLMWAHQERVLHRLSLGAVAPRPPKTNG